MRTVPLSRRRQNLSAYLDRVRAGESLVITDRGQAVAVLVPVAWDPKGTRR